MKAKHVVLVYVLIIPSTILSFRTPPSPHLHSQLYPLYAFKNDKDKPSKQESPHPFSQFFNDLLPTTPLPPKQDKTKTKATAASRPDNDDDDIDDNDPAILLSKYENRISILQHALQQKVNELDTQKRRVDILQDVTLQLKEREDTYYQRCTSLDNELRSVKEQWTVANTTMLQKWEKEKETVLKRWSDDESVILECRNKIKKMTQQVENAERESNVMKKQQESREMETRRILKEERSKRERVDKEKRAISDELNELRKQVQKQQKDIKKLRDEENAKKRDREEQALRRKNETEHAASREEQESIEIAKASVKASQERERNLLLKLENLERERKVIQAGKLKLEQELVAIKKEQEKQISLAQNNDVTSHRSSSEEESQSKRELQRLKTLLATYQEAIKKLEGENDDLNTMLTEERVKIAAERRKDRHTFEDVIKAERSNYEKQLTLLRVQLNDKNDDIKELLATATSDVSQRRRRQPQQPPPPAVTVSKTTDQKYEEISHPSAVIPKKTNGTNTDGVSFWGRVTSRPRRWFFRRRRRRE